MGGVVVDQKCDKTETSLASYFSSADDFEHRRCSKNALEQSSCCVYDRMHSGAVLSVGHPRFGRLANNCKKGKKEEKKNRKLNVKSKNKLIVRVEHKGRNGWFKTVKSRAV